MYAPAEIKQGDIISLTLKTNPEAYKLSGSMFDKPVNFYKDSNKNVYTALIGVDMDAEPDLYSLTISAENEHGEKVKKIVNINVKSAGFSIQRLTLPKEKVELDEATLSRVKLEDEKLGKIWDIFTDARLWNGDFILPVKGELSNDFGLRRIINGEPKKPHSGADIDAPYGAPVYAPNDGRVVFVDELFFSGNSVFIDHGMGLFSMYFHLSEALVKEGDTVKKGQIIAKVGSSGRATGPHLHWGIRLNGARVNPASLLSGKED